MSGRSGRETLDEAEVLYILYISAKHTYGTHSDLRSPTFFSAIRTHSLHWPSVNLLHWSLLFGWHNYHNHQSSVRSMHQGECVVTHLAPKARVVPPIWPPSFHSWAIFSMINKLSIDMSCASVSSVSSTKGCALRCGHMVKQCLSFKAVTRWNGKRKGSMMSSEASTKSCTRYCPCS